MTTNLSDYKISSFILTIDLLGTAQRMAEPNWFCLLSELLDAMLFSINEAVELHQDDKLQIFQYGDSVSLCHDNPDLLVRIAIEIQKKYLKNRILAQIGISGGDVYHIDKSCLHIHWERDNNIHLQSLVGQGMARSHLITKGIKGPCIVIDEEIKHVSAQPGGWQKVTGSSENDSKIKISEVWWWRDIPEVEGQIQKLLDEANKKLAIEKKENSERNIRAEREIRSLENRVEHLKAFLDRCKSHPALRHSPI